MKTRVFKFSGVLSLIMLVVGAVSCGSSMPSPKDVAEKIESHDVLAEADYTTMIDYCGEYAKKAQKYFDIINSQSDSLSAESVQATSEIGRAHV